MLTVDSSIFASNSLSLHPHYVPGKFFSLLPHTTPLYNLDIISTITTMISISPPSRLYPPRLNRDAEYQEAFALFDKRGTSRVPRESLGELLRSLGQNPTQREVAELQGKVGGTCECWVYIRLFVREAGLFRLRKRHAALKQSGLRSTRRRKANPMIVVSISLVSFHADGCAMTSTSIAGRRSSSFRYPHVQPKLDLASSRLQRVSTDP